MIAALAACVIAALVAFPDEAPDISGRWSGEGWGTVVVKQIDGGTYAGIYTDTFSKQPGDIHVTWSRIERRFNGTWREGDDRFGELSIRLVDGEIRGALTTDAKSKINPATPRLADVLWVRAKIETKPPAPVPSVRHVRALVGAEGAVHGLMLSNDGKLLYASTAWPIGDKRIRVQMGLPSGELRDSLAGHPVNVNTLALSPDGNRFLSGGKDGRVVMWDAKTNTPLKSFLFSARRRSASSPGMQDGKSFVACSPDKHVRLVNVDSGETVWDGIGHVAADQGAAFLPGDRQIPTGDEKGKILLWDVATRNEHRLSGDRTPRLLDALDDAAPGRQARPHRRQAGRHLGPGTRARNW